MGDVVVSESILYYEPGKVRVDGNERRHVMMPSDSLLLDRIRNLGAMHWSSKIPVPPPAPRNVGAQIHLGPIACGEKVVANDEFVRGLICLQPKLVGIEMESWGVSKAAECAVPPIGFLAIRGISDFSDAKKNDDWQPHAASAAATWVFEFLKTGPISLLPRTERKGIAAEPRAQKILLNWKGIPGAEYRVIVGDDSILSTRTEALGRPPEATRQKIINEREFHVVVDSVRRNGVIHLTCTPMAGRFESLFADARVMWEGSRNHRGKIRTKLDVEVPDRDAKQYLQIMFTDLLKDVLDFTAEFEMSPRGTILLAKGSGAPLEAGMSSPEDAVREQAQMMNWMVSTSDAAAGFGAAVFIPLPGEAVGVGDNWEVRRVLDVAGMTFEGTSAMEVSSLEWIGEGTIAHIHEKSFFDLNLEKFDKRREGAFMAQFHEAAMEGESRAAKRVEVVADWIFDATQGELISKQSEMSLAFTVKSIIDDDESRTKVKSASDLISKSSVHWSRL